MSKHPTTNTPNDIHNTGSIKPVNPKENEGHSHGHNNKNPEEPRITEQEILHAQRHKEAETRDREIERKVIDKWKAYVAKQKEERQQTKR